MDGETDRMRQSLTEAQAIINYVTQEDHTQRLRQKDPLTLNVYLMARNPLYTQFIHI